MSETCESDLLIIGAGPTGLAAAINGASEGLSVRILDGGTTLGGQAKESAAIENYPGYAESVTGEFLMGQMVSQALKFNTKMLSPVTASQLRQENAKDGKPRFIITTDDYQECVSKTVLLALGLSYRRLQADGLAPFMGRGAYYGRPLGLMPPTKKCEVAVVGGANSAGQAVLALAVNPKVHVRLLVRKTIAEQMSTYLIDRIRAAPNVELCEHCEVTHTMGDSTRLKMIKVHRTDVNNDIIYDVDNMFIFIGATPRTLWLHGTGIELSTDRYILSWDDTTRADALPYETSQPGIFVAGDVRNGSVKRIAAGIGEGVGALGMIHKYLTVTP